MRSLAADPRFFARLNDLRHVRARNLAVVVSVPNPTTEGRATFVQIHTTRRMITGVFSSSTRQVDESCVSHSNFLSF